MTKADVLAGVAAKPVPFEVNGTTVLLRPIRFGDRVDLGHWYREHKEQPGSGAALQRRLVALSVSDQSGGLILSEADVDTLDALAVDAIAAEVATRNGLDKDEGKSEPATGN